jgi:hypothetical protein
MDQKEILKRLVPCGLSCEKCFAYANGNIKHHSEKLKKYLGSFEIYAKRFVTLINETVFEKYPDFKQMLDYFSDVKCKGCRFEECKIFENCKVKECSNKKKVDFCFQCSQFPCDSSGFDGHLKIRWININNRMQEIGIENYYEETKDSARY